MAFTFWFKYIMLFSAVAGFMYFYFKGRRIIYEILPNRDKAELIEKFKFCSIFLVDRSGLISSSILQLVNIEIYNKDFFIKPSPMVVWDNRDSKDCMVHKIDFEDIVDLSIIEKKMPFKKKTGIKLVFKDSHEVTEYIIRCASCRKLYRRLKSKYDLYNNGH